MAFVAGFQSDVFVTYAHVDDVPLPGAPAGWVTTLIDTMKIYLAQRLGRADALAVWQDLGLARNVPVTKTIVDAVRDSALLLVILSEGYLESPWCARERNGFLALAGSETRRLFVVERSPVGRENKPAEFKDLLGYPFWVRDQSRGIARTLGDPFPTPAEPEYYQRVNMLSSEMANELKRMRV